ncbi:MAG: V-type ATP synthase subunit D [Thermodesulfobacteriota bacterium]
MARQGYTKTALKRERDDLALYRRFLPSLDLKRQHFQAAVERERQQLAELEAGRQAMLDEAAEWLGLLAADGIDGRDIVRIADIAGGRENLLGAELPVLEEIRFERSDYSLLDAPLWMDGLVLAAEEILRLDIEVEFHHRRLAILQKELTVLTQRVNLFDKVLIPKASSTIRRINIVLGDQERTAVVRAKIAKKRGED